MTKEEFIIEVFDMEEAYNLIKLWGIDGALRDAEATIGEIRWKFTTRKRKS